MSRSTERSTSHEALEPGTNSRVRSSRSRAGPVTALVKIDVGAGQHVTATLTAEAADDLGLTDGPPVTAIFKASAVILGVE